MQFRNLGRYRTGGTGSRMDLSIPLPQTPDGRVYRYSPNEKALPRHFVLGDAVANFVITDDSRNRMKLTPRSTQTVCPYSGMIAEDDAFQHPDDVKAATQVVAHAFRADAEEELRSMLRNWERQFSSSKFLKIKACSRSAPKPRPRFLRRDLLRELVCDHCGRDYGVYAIALFCPDCGAPNLRLHFAREGEIVVQQITFADTQKGHEELAYRLMGNAHEDVLTAFEATLKAVYVYGTDQRGPDAPETKPVRNDFQNIERAQLRFAELNFDPFATLLEDDLAALKLNIQKRHIIGHNLGIMDEKFADYADDARVGETVHLVGEDIRSFAALAQRVVDALDAWLAGGVPAATLLPVPLPERSETPMTSTPPTYNPSSDIGISELAVRLGTWLVRQSENGMTDPIDDAPLRAAFANVEERALVEAIAELKAEGCLTTTALLNTALPRICATLDLFATFDTVAEISDPVADSLMLVDIVLQGEDLVNTADLHQKTGWPIRRFNPAVGLLISQIDERHVSRESQHEYPSRHFFLTADDRVAMKRYKVNFSR